MRDNDLIDLWGLESLRGLTILSAQNNRLRNISALATLQNLDVINLENNELEFFSALKELTNLRIYKYEGNPVYEKDVERMALNGLNYMRRSYPEGIPYDFTPESKPEELEECIVSSAIRADFVFFRTLMTNPVISARLADEEFLESSPVPLRKIFLAVQHAGLMTGTMISFYMDQSSEDMFAKVDYVMNKRAQLEKFFEYYLAEGDFFPYNEVQLESLKAHLKGFVSSRINCDPLHPRNLENAIKSWEDRIKRTGIPPGIKGGFRSM